MAEPDPGGHPSPSPGHPQGMWGHPGPCSGQVHGHEGQWLCLPFFMGERLETHQERETRWEEVDPGC